VGKRPTKKKNTYVAERGTTLASIRNMVNEKTPIAVMRKAQRLSQITMYLMMAKQAEIWSAVKYLKQFNYKS
jgi:hypothetical protein